MPLHKRSQRQSLQLLPITLHGPGAKDNTAVRVRVHLMVYMRHAIGLIGKFLHVCLEVLCAASLACI
jgi:hypothetical protein